MAVTTDSASTGATASETGDSLSGTTVGMSGRIEQLVLPGTELIARPLADARSPIVLLTEARPDGWPI